jgi:hypothetical protein
MDIQLLGIERKLDANGRRLAVVTALLSIVLLILVLLSIAALVVTP